jgi:hypothetical protein
MCVSHPQLSVLIIEQNDIDQPCSSLYLGCDSVSFLLLAGYLVHLLHCITCAKFHHQIRYFLF